VEAAGRFPFIQLREGTSVRRLTDAGFAAAGVAPAATLSADTIGTVSALIAQGLGVSAFPGSTWPLVTMPGIRFVRLDAPAVARAKSVLVPRAPWPTPKVRELRSAVIAAWAIAEP
jgi:DNA-binding transcriptional LysR family regulator